MLRVGLTGGIGSGKSLVAAIFEVLGIPVYYADIEAKKLMETDKELRYEIMKLFGEQAFTEIGLNRPFISEKIFQDNSLRTQLNQIVHPKTIEHANQWFAQQSAPYAIKEAALIFESSSEQYLHAVIGVFAPQHLRIQRVMKRDGISETAVLAKMNSQMSEDTKMGLCDYVLYNNEKDMLLTDVLQLHETLLMQSTSA